MTNVNLGFLFLTRVSFQLLAIVDLDKNGLIDYNEFKAMMTADEDSGDCRQQ